MKQSVTIRIDVLPDSAKKELSEFYEYFLNGILYIEDDSKRRSTDGKKTGLVLS